MSKKTKAQRQRLNQKRQKREVRNTLRHKENQEAVETLRKAKKGEVELFSQKITPIASLGKLRQATGDPFPSSYASIKNTNQVPFTDSTSTELNWASAILQNESQTLNASIPALQNFNRHLILENHKEAKAALENIKKTFGVSYWYTDATLLLAEYSNGLKANRDTLQSIVATNKGNAITQIFAIFSSQRAERKLSSANYLKELELFCRKYQSDNTYSRFISLLKFYSAFQSLSEFPDLPHILYRSGTFPAIDRLNNYIRVSQVLHATGVTDAQHHLSIQATANAIADTRLLNLQILTDPATPIPAESTRDQLISLADAYTVGDYELSLRTSRELLHEHPDRLEYYEFYIKSELYLGRESAPPFKEGSIASRIFYSLRAAIKKTDDTPEALQTLEKLALSLDSMQIGSQIHAYILSQKHPQHPLAPKVFDGLNATAATAKLATAYPTQSSALRFLENLGRTYPGSPSVELYTDLFNHNPSALSGYEIPTNRKRIYRAHAFYRTGQLQKAISEYQGLWNNRDVSQPLREGVLIGLFQSFLAAGNLTKCASIIADAFLTQRHLLTSLPIAELLAAYEQQEDNRSHMQDISWPIVYFIVYATEGRNRDNEQLHKTYDNFLSAHGLTKPSELSAVQNTLPQAKLIFFLRYLCVHEVMDCSIWFESTAELEAERIAVCQLLLAIDPGNSESYNQEISRLTQVGMIRKAIQHLDDSKVYIDTAGITQSLDKTFRERFDRYIVFSQLEDRLRQAFELHSVELQAGKPLIITTNDSPQQFSELFGEIKNRFISSNEYGLDSYLSVRIRHGTLSGQLRSQFERESLITRKNATDGVYDSNDYWNDRVFQSYGPQISARADRYLQDFSRQVDAIIDAVKHRWIQIKGPSNNNEGLFDFDYSDSEIKQLSASITRLIAQNAKSSTIDDYAIFLQEIFSALWQRTEASLARVVEKIKTTLRNQLTTSIDLMAANIFNLHQDIRHSPFGNAITRCRTYIQNETETVAAWFKNANDKTAPDFDFILLANTAEEIVKNCFPSSHLSAQTRVSPSATFRGNLFAFFVDIMFILLENIVKHSKVENPVATISARLENNRLFIRIDNTVSPHVDRENLETHLGRINKIRASALTPRAIRTEGGSGYLKLHKLIRYDLERGNDYSVSISAKDSTLSVCIDMDATRLMA
ncbi:hypothetical protein COCOR_04660 [Corallococcus coralloides DSM 2259]|uniref:Uncharacterized protein n=1 Tax=Corallococcus coralloides (strain ATCC 25202 / DSM 2259 / NBRC 100086 / M2) TaxID=1144275 RepID=H8MJD0_CORCM|nr:hypothetical protein [Corallococcus coralloides]AFE05948.1 hypothetical protein COCOR_04660 [Corallococcus coralloides DSM 2259]